MAFASSTEWEAQAAHNSRPRAAAVEQPTSGTEYDYTGMAEESTESDGLKRLAKLAHAQVTAEKAVSDAEAMLERRKNELRVIAADAIPDLMDSLDLKEFTTSDGLKVTVKTDIRASASEKKDPVRFGNLCKWLAEHNHDRLVKNEIGVRLEREQGGMVPDVVAALRAFHLEPVQERTINAQTLSAFVRGELEKGTELPEDLFAVFRQREAKVAV